MTLNSFLLRNLSLAVIAPLLFALAGNRAHADGLHLALVKSDPANAARLTRSPKAIDLWFSQKPNLKLTRIVLTKAEHDTLKLNNPVHVDTSGKHVSAGLVAALPVGKYDVSWRTLSRDGHAVSGRFSFTIDSSASRATVTGTVTGSSSTARKPR